MKKNKFKKLLASSAMGIMALAMPFSLTGCGSSEVLVRTNENYVQWSTDGKSWTNVITVDEVKDMLGEAYKGDTGANGREVEFDTTNTHIVWKYTNETENEWKNLVLLSELKGVRGDSGINPHIGINGNWWIGTTDTGIYANNVIRFGDVNLDNRVDNSDLTAFDQYFNNNTLIGSVASQNADVDCDGVLTKSDKKILSIYLTNPNLNISLPCNVKYGDLDLNGIISEADYELLQNYLNSSAELSILQKLNADYNKDGVIDASDSVLIKKVADSLEDKVLIDFDVNDGIMPSGFNSSIYVTMGTTISQLPIPTYKHSENLITFKGWFISKDGEVTQNSQQVTTSTIITEDVTLIAQWNNLATMYGDVNNDRQVGIVDLLLVGQYVSGYNVQIDKFNADVNCDGVVAFDDKLLISKYLIQEVELPFLHRTGDINLDGDVNTSDLTLLQKYLNDDIELNDTQYVLADLTTTNNIQNTVDINDARVLESYLNEEIASLKDQYLVLKLDVNGGVEPDNFRNYVIVKHGQSLEELPVLEYTYAKDLITFKGWFTSKDGEVTPNDQQVTTSTIITKDTKLIAQWNNLATMYGDVNNDGRVNPVDLILIGQYLSGYNIQIDKINADVNCDGVVAFDDVVIIRMYRAGGYSVELPFLYKMGDVDLNGVIDQEDVDLLQEYANGTTEFSNLQRALSKVSSTIDDIEKDFILLRDYVAKKIDTLFGVQYYFIGFDCDGAESIESVYTIANFQLKELPIPTKEGFTFKGWFTINSNGEVTEDSKQITTETIITNNISVKAVWEQDQ